MREPDRLDPGRRLRARPRLALAPGPVGCRRRCCFRTSSEPPRRRRARQQPLRACTRSCSAPLWLGERRHRLRAREAGGSRARRRGELARVPPRAARRRPCPRRSRRGGGGARAGDAGGVAGRRARARVSRSRRFATLWLARYLASGEARDGAAALAGFALAAAAWPPLVLLLLAAVVAVARALVRGAPPRAVAGRGGADRDPGARLRRLLRRPRRVAGVRGRWRTAAGATCRDPRSPASGRSRSGSACCRRSRRSAPPSTGRRADAAADRRLLRARDRPARARGRNRGRERARREARASWSSPCCPILPALMALAANALTRPYPRPAMLAVGAVATLAVAAVPRAVSDGFEPRAPGVELARRLGSAPLVWWLSIVIAVVARDAGAAGGRDQGRARRGSQPSWCYSCCSRSRPASSPPAARPARVAGTLHGRLPVLPTGSSSVAVLVDGPVDRVPPRCSSGTATPRSSSRRSRRDRSIR